MLSELLKQYDHVCKQFMLGRALLARGAMASMLTGGHILIEDIPGVGKTTFALMLAKLSGLPLTRIQCTNDMLPSDLIGPLIWHPGKHEFSFRPGPIFSPMVLVDELNRAPSKTQSGLLQAMEEKRVSVDGRDLELPAPFIVLATQNPSDGVGSNPLPESQIDRFCISFNLLIPNPEVELQMIQNADIKSTIQQLPQLLEAKYFLQAKNELAHIFVHPDLLQYMMALLQNARQRPSSAMLLSTRAGRDLVQVSKALAFMDGKKEVMPHHIVEIFPSVAGHRLGGSKGVQFGQTLAKEILAEVPLP